MRYSAGNLIIRSNTLDKIKTCIQFNLLKEMNDFF